MSAAATNPADAAPAPKKGSKMPLLLGLVLAALGGGGGFYAVQAGYIGGAAPAADEHAAPADAHAEAAGHDSGHGAPAAVAFVPLEPVLVNLPGGGERFLRFAAQLEVEPSHVEEVTAITPRIVDVLNGYLRAVEVAEIENPSALLGLRAQMLRRVQVVAGADRVRDLLVMEFVVN